MTRSTPAIALALLLPLAAAGPVPSPEAFAGALGLKHGGWHSRVRVTGAEVDPVPGADPATIARIRAAIGSRVGEVREMNECVGPAPAGGLILPGLRIRSGCAFSRLEASGGRWALTARCGDPGKGADAAFAVEGSYSSDAMTGRHDIQAYAPEAIIRLRAEATSRFTGPECRPTPAVVVPGP